MKCPHCGQEHPDNTKFCPETGKKLESQFLFCNNSDCDFRQPLPLNTKFCPNCGQPLNSANADCHNGKKSAASLVSHGEGLIFPIFDIVLGETSIKELCEENKYYQVGSFDLENGGRILRITSSIDVIAPFDQAPIDMIHSNDYNEDIEVWNQLIPLQENISIGKIAKFCKKNNLPF